MIEKGRVNVTQEAVAFVRARIDENRCPARPLNSRQLDTLFLICKGLRNAEIATQLQVAERTVKGYVAQLLLIFDVTNRTELAARAF